VKKCICWCLSIIDFKTNFHRSAQYQISRKSV